MKKTLITLMALASCAMGETTYTVLTDVTQVTSSNATTTIANNTALTGSLALTIDVDSFKDTLGTTTGRNSNVFIAKLTGKWEDNADGSLGFVTWGNDNSNGIEGSWAKGTVSGNIHAGLQSCYTAVDGENPIDWDNVVAMTLVMSYEPPANALVAGDQSYMTYNMAVSYLYSDGSITTSGGSNTNLLRFGETNTFCVSGVTVDTSYVDAYTVYSDYLTLDQAKALSAARVVPEPTTATLSLLALCGLAARRRRK